MLNVCLLFENKIDEIHLQIQFRDEENNLAATQPPRDINTYSIVFVGVL